VQISKIETSAAQSANCILLHAYIAYIGLCYSCVVPSCSNTEKIHVAYGSLLLKI